MKKHVATFNISIVLVAILSSCQNKNEQMLKDGEQLARTHCTSCHAFPEPSLLNKKIWDENVLPLMGQFMNVEMYYQPYNNSGPSGNADGMSRQAPDHFFPFDKWEKIVKWYIATAPEKTIERKDSLAKVTMHLDHFSLHRLQNIVPYPITTFIRYDTTVKKVLFGDGKAGKLFTVSNDYTAHEYCKVLTGITDVNVRANGYEAITMGDLMPTDEKLGKLTKVTPEKAPQIIIDSLQRPVQAKYADLNSDGLEDVIICEFGFRRGALNWYENKGNGKYVKHALRVLPGAISLQIYDFNKDGKPDIAALMAQGDEGVFIYYNEGNGKFKEDRVLQFPPAYGSNFFELVDINKDGFMDILTTNGDNGDYSLILKPYHGIRIFLNNGKNKYTEKTFLPVFGIQKALARDFDNDGDLDIASIAFFPDYTNHPEESFLYWQNNGDFTFKRFTLENGNDGRWMTMDANDIDNDGDIDILLGSALFTLGDIPSSLKDKWKKSPVSAFILENTLHKK